MKAWIFILLVMASASSVVNARIDVPGNARHVTMHSIATD
jgi:hypothetical protein